MEFPDRKATRLHGYDYSKQNYYYITICTHDKRYLFGKPNDLNTYGKCAEDQLLKIPQYFDGVRVDKYIIMPNHIHAIIVIGCDDVAKRSRPFPKLSIVVGLYKSGVSKIIHLSDPDMIVWQKSFYDQIIRDKASYREVWKYIDENPQKWENDKYFTLNSIG